MVTKDEINILRNTQYSIIIFGAIEAEIYGFANDARQDGAQSMFFIKEMIEASNDDESSKFVGQENGGNVFHLGAEVF